MDDRQRVQALIALLDETYGRLSWWDAPFDEIVIGAILTQQTRFENVEKAISRLREAGICTLSKIVAADRDLLEECIRCTGFYRVKAERLTGLAAFICTVCEESPTDDEGEVRPGGRESTVPELLPGMPTEALREALLSVKGVGEETADSILCYGLKRNVFVLDAYTHRISACAGITVQKNRLRELFSEELAHDNDLLRSCHGQLVEYAKEYCNTKRCLECRIMTLAE